MKYTGSGTWTGNGVTDLANPQNGGGAFTQIASDPAGSSYIPNVRYDSYTNTYIMVYIIVNSGNTTSQINAQTSTDGLSWSGPRTLVTGASGLGGTNMIYYPTLFDTSGGDPQTLGQNFSVFYVQPFNQPGTGWANFGLYTTALSVGQGPLPPVLNQPTVVVGSRASSTPAASFSCVNRKRLGKAMQLYAASRPRRFRCNLATTRPELRAARHPAPGDPINTALPPKLRLGWTRIGIGV